MDSNKTSFIYFFLIFTGCLLYTLASDKLSTTTALTTAETTSITTTTNSSEEINPPSASLVNNETKSPFDFMYKYLNEKGYDKMSSLMKTADIDNILTSLRTFTLFAPSNDAFALIPGSVIEEIYDYPLRRKEFVLRHLVPGNLLLGGLAPNQELTTSTLDGKKLDIVAYPKGFVASGAKIIDGDIPIGQSKHTVHFIDKILYPAANKNIAELTDILFDRMSRYLDMSGLRKELSSNLLTFFAPTDEAFRALPWLVTEQMLINTTFLKLVIENHIIPGSFYSLGLPGSIIYSIAGEPLNFTTKIVQQQKLILVNSVPIIRPDLVATNGVIHGISRLILSPKFLEDCKCNKELTETINTTPNSRDLTITEKVDGYSTLLPSTQTNSFFQRAPVLDDLNNHYSSNSYTSDPELYNSYPTFEGREFGYSPEETISSTPFPYHNIWDDLRANHNLTTSAAPPNETDVKPSYFRNTLPSSNPTDSDINNTLTTVSTSVPVWGVRNGVVRSQSRLDRTGERNQKNQTNYNESVVYYTEDKTNSPFEISTTTNRPKEPNVFRRTSPRPIITSTLYPNDVTQESFGTRNQNPYRQTTPSFYGRSPQDKSEVVYTAHDPYLRSTSNPYSPRKPFQGSYYITTSKPYIPSTYETSTTASLSNRPYFRRPDLKYEADVDIDPLLFTENPFRRQHSFDTTKSPNSFLPYGVTTQTSVYFDSTRKPTTRSPYDLWATSTPLYFKKRNEDNVATTRENERIPHPLHNNTRYQPNTTYRPYRTITTAKPNKETTTGHYLDDQSIRGIMAEPGLVLDDKPISFSVFNDLVNRAGLSLLLSSRNPVTVFVPTDEAFANLTNEEFNNVVKDPNKMRNLVLRHFINRPLQPNEIKDGLVLNTLANEPLTVSLLDDGKRVFVGDSPILAATNANNGNVYVLGKILDDENVKTKSKPLLEELSHLPQLSTFAALLARTKLPEMLKEGEFTLLAPENNAFGELSTQIKQALQSNPKAIERLVANHIFNGTLNSDKLGQSRNILPLQAQKPLRINKFPGATIINNQASIKKSDIETDNGVIHILNKILLPDDEEFKTMIAGNHLNTQNRGERNSTRPTNGKERYPNRNLIPTKEPVRPTVASRQPTRDPTRQPFRTSNRSGSDSNRTLNPNRDGSRRVPVFETDEEDEMNRLGYSMNAHRFIEWLKKSGVLNEVKKNSEPYTVVIPTDEAIDKLPTNVIHILNTNPKELRSLLEYHVIPSGVSLNSLKEGQVLKSLNNKPIRYISGTLSGAYVIQTKKKNDMNAIAVDRVLYPPQGDIYKVVSSSPLLQTMSKIIRNAGLVKEFTESELSLLAPTDEAFKMLGTEMVEKLLKDRKSSREFLLRHTLKPIFFTSSIPLNDDGSKIDNLNREKLSLLRKPGNIYCVSVDGVTLAFADITANNGVLHVLNHVL